LISVITDTKELRVLGLKNNQINDQVVLELTRKIGKFKSLEEIDVSQNPEITDRGAAALLFLAGKIPKLRRIDVAGTSVSLDLAHQILSRVNKTE
jgi:Leucine-rich repeat (LRR) protein